MVSAVADFPKNHDLILEEITVTDLFEKHFTDLLN
jgi:hypothetical protein